MATKTQKQSKAVTAKAAARAKAAKRAPGNAKALQQKAADNVKRLNDAKGKPETVRSAVAARTGNGLVVTTSRERSIVVTRIDSTVNKLAQMGKLVEPLETYLKSQPKPQARLARGVEGKMTENSRKAVADQKQPAKAKSAENKGKARTEKAAKAKQPARGGNRTYKLAGRKDESKPGTFRTYMLSTIMAHKDTDSAKAAHAKSRQYPNHKLDFNWAAQQGYIAFTGK